MRTLAAVVVAVAALATAGSAAAAERPDFQVTLAGRTAFPHRALILSLPTGERLPADRVKVHENGEPVRDLRITPIGSLATSGFAIAIVIDTSNSMRGEPIEDALAAARRLVLRRNSNQPVGLFGFSSRARVLLPFTTDEQKIMDRLQLGVSLAEGTHIYDGVKQALDAIRTSSVWPASIVLLSDGADTGSSTPLSRVVREARSNHIRVFSVGLHSDAYDASTLEALAADTRGTYAEASASEELSQIFDTIGAKLSTEYLIRYRSSAPAGRTVHVAIEVDGHPGVATTGYRTKALPQAYVEPYEESTWQRVWTSPVAMVVVALVVALLLAGGLVLLLVRPGRGVRGRISQFVSILRTPEPAVRRRSLTLALLRGAERPLSQSQRWSQFKEELEIAKIRLPAVQLILWTVVAVVAASWVLLALGAGVLTVPVVVLIPLAVRSFVKFRLKRVRDRFAEQLPENLQVLASALRAGHSFIGALSVVVEESDEPSTSEFRTVVRDEQLGISLEDALLVVVRRMDSRDLEQVALVAALQREAGGSVAEVLDRVTETVRGRFEIRRLIASLTAQGRLSRWILSFLPVGLLLAITVLNPAYTEPLYGTTAGRILLAIGGLMVIAGSLVIKRIIDIKV